MSFTDYVYSRTMTTGTHDDNGRPVGRTPQSIDVLVTNLLSSRTPILTIADFLFLLLYKDLLAEEVKGNFN